jgi:hypothetical protein
MMPAVLIYALALVLWFGTEDRSPGYVTTLGACGAALTAAHATRDAWGRSLRAATSGRRLAWRGFGGLLAGLLAGPLIGSLMVVKISLHGHNTPDFTLEELVGSLARAPVWTAAGLLAGLGIGLLDIAFHRASQGN